MFQTAKRIANFFLILALFFIAATPAFASDIIVVPTSGTSYGSHEIWAHNQIGQSFKAEASRVKGGFRVEYSPESAFLMQPNAPTTEIVLRLYYGEGLDNTKLLHQTTRTVDTTTKGFIDVDYAAEGLLLEKGVMYTIGISSPYNRGWIIPSVCSYTKSRKQPTGAYSFGHPFFNGVMVTNETGICDNAFHMVDLSQ